MFFYSEHQTKEHHESVAWLKEVPDLFNMDAMAE